MNTEWLVSAIELLLTSVILIKHCCEGLLGITQFMLSGNDEIFEYNIFQSLPLSVLNSILRLVTFKLFHFINSVVVGSQISPPFGATIVIREVSRKVISFEFSL